MPETPFHEAAEIFPLDDGNIGDLAKDIRKNGLLVPIETLDGKILDGRRRWLACKKLGIEPATRTVSVDDPVAYVLSLNLHRRHLTTSQRAMIGARAKKMYDEQAKERQRLSCGRGQKGQKKVTDLNIGQSRDHVGAKVGVAGPTIDDAKKVLTRGIPEVVAAVDSGELTVSAGADIVERPHAEQREIINAKNPREKLKELSASTSNGQEEHKVKGVGIFRANEAINCLTRIPKNDALRERGFQLVTDWIRRNR